MKKIYLVKATRQTKTGLTILGFPDEKEAQDYLNKEGYTFTSGEWVDPYDLMKETLLKEISADADILGIIPARNWHLLDVLVDRKTEYEPYVTWVYNIAFQSFVEGHYFKDLEEAKKDFIKRGVWD